MNKKLLLPFLGLASLSGCVISNSAPGYWGDVIFSWTFAGSQCSAVPQVATVRITIPGEVLQNDGVYPCSTGGYAGITLRDFAPGNYSFTIDGISYANQVLYTGSGQFHVDGNTYVNVDLSPIGSATSYAYLMWTFPANSLSPNPTCDQAIPGGVAYVDVSIDRGAATRYGCPAGMVAPGVQTPFLSPGTHQVDLTGVDSNGYPYFRSVGNLITYAGTPVSSTYQIAWNVGGVSLGWQLIDGLVQRTCAQAGVQTVSVNFRDANGNLVYGPNGDPQACDGAPILYNALIQGNYQVFLLASGSTGTYRSSTATPPTLSVVAGRFVDAQSSPFTVQMYRQ